MVNSNFDKDMQKQVEESLLTDRRRRLHELVIALIRQKDDFELLDAEAPDLEKTITGEKALDPARWLDRNRRVLKSYQSLVRSAVTLDALLDAEEPFDV